MQAQVFDIEHRQAAGFEDLHHFADARGISARKYAAFDPGVHRRRPVAPDRVD
jgi:hypothetical protein